MKRARPRVVVVGAGIAGASLGAALVRDAEVVVLEREPQPGYHATGRSAALFSEVYGGALVRRLSRASREFFARPPPGFADTPLLRPRGALYVAPAAQGEAFRALRTAPDVAAGMREITPAEADRLVPILRTGWTAHAAFEPGAMDVDVHALHRGFLRQLTAGGGRVACDEEVIGLSHTGGRWRVATHRRAYDAEIVVNAAGAWADELARIAGVTPLGLTPRRRTAVLVDPPADIDVASWPMVIDAAESFYFKPDAGKILVSPADETESAPCDAQPDDFDVAVAIDRFETATCHAVQRLGQRWAGLRTFTPDREPVAGYAPDAPGFFWLVGQGGYGIQTAPALARAAAAILTGRALSAELRAAGLEAAHFSPARLRGG